jgi:hypothetical protein
MDANSFQFLLTMPGDKRMIGALRDLCAYAATYANVEASRGQAFAEEVVDTAQNIAAATGASDAPLEFRFEADAAAIRVTISAPDQPPTCVSTTR